MKTYIIFIITAMVLLVSCEGYLDKFPLDAPSSETFPQTVEELELAINGAYNALYFNQDYMQAELWFDGATDICFIRGTFLAIDGIVMSTATPSTYIFSTVWERRYAAIQRSNFILENIETARENIDTTITNRVEAEAKFLRAYHYMQLTELFGDVPFVTQSLNIDNANLPRGKKSVIVDALISDLNFAVQYLPDSYTAALTGKATRGAAAALLSRIALYNERFDIAKSAAEEVMAIGYTLHPDYGELFQIGGKNSNEIIFNLSYHQDVVRNFSQVIMNTRAGSGWSVSVPTQWLVDSYLCSDGLPIDESPLYDQANPYANRDSRLGHSIVVPQSSFAGYTFETHPDSIQTWYKGTRVNNQEVTNAYATFTGYVWRKNCDESVFETTWRGSVMPLTLIRYAEVLLNYAEAKIETNDIDASVYEAINQIRQRAGMPDIPGGLSQEELRDVLRQERKIELAGEGLRLFDIRRWKIAEHVLPGDLPGRKYKDVWYSPGVPDINQYGHPVYSNQNDIFNVIQARTFDLTRDYLWPIPQKERDININLTQNDGY